MSVPASSILWRKPAQLVPADAVSGESLRGAVNGAFADHFPAVPAISLAGWPAFLRDRGVDLPLSTLLVRAGEVHAFALLTPRPQKRTRIALFGTVPGQRRSGLAAQLLDAVLARANVRRETSVELEVVAQNHPAMKACWARGFKPLGRLFGFSSKGHERVRTTGGPEEPVVTRVSWQEATEWLRDLDALDAAELPWPVSAPALPARRSVQAWQCERAQLVFETVAGVRVAVRSLVDRDPDQRGAAQLLSTLREHYPDATFSTLPVFRQDGAARAFEANGWKRLTHYQWWLHWSLCG